MSKSNVELLRTMAFVPGNLVKRKLQTNGES